MFVLTKICESCVFPPYFRTKKLGNIMVFYAVIATSEMILKFFLNSLNAVAKRHVPQRKHNKVFSFIISASFDDSKLFLFKNQ